MWLQASIFTSKNIAKLTDGLQIVKKYIKNQYSGSRVQFLKFCLGKKCAGGRRNMVFIFPLWVAFKRARSCIQLSSIDFCYCSMFTEQSHPQAWVVFIFKGNINIHTINYLELHQDKFMSIWIIHGGKDLSYWEVSGFLSCIFK